MPTARSCHWAAPLDRRWLDAHRWRGRFDIPEGAGYQALRGALPLRVSVQSRRGAWAAADPATAVTINDPAHWGSGLSWAGLEAMRAGVDSAAGGPDTWHRLGEGPALSLLIILDGSGSMNDGNRHSNARAGITQTFENLPDDQLIEFAAVSIGTPVAPGQGPNGLSAACGAPTKSRSKQAGGRQQVKLALISHWGTAQILRKPQ